LTQTVRSLLVVSVLVLLDVRLEVCRIKRAVKLQGSRERPAALRQRETFEVGMQMRTTSTGGASRVGKQDSLDRNDAQQC
jgi:hypothetical protein